VQQFAPIVQFLAKKIAPERKTGAKNSDFLFVKRGAHTRRCPFAAALIVCYY
jgi:hypothetical protein